MSKRRRRRRNSLRRKSSRCTKHSQSQYTSQSQSQSSNNNSGVYKRDQLEKGESDSLRPESFFADSDAGEDTGYEADSTEKRFRASGSESAPQDDSKSPGSEVEEADGGVRITTLVRVDDCEVSSSRTVLQNPCESAGRDEARGSVSVTTTKVTCSRSKVEVEINEVMHSDSSDIKTTLVVRDRTGRRKGDGSRSRWDDRAAPNNEKPSQPYSASHNFDAATCGHHRQCKSKNYKLSISEINTDLTELANSQVQSGHQEQRLCCRSCCEEGIYGHNYVLRERFSSMSALSDTCLRVAEQPLTSTVNSAASTDIPLPREFVDKGFNPLDDLTENISSCQIVSGDNFDNRGGRMASTAPARPSDSGEKAESLCRDSRERESLGDGEELLERLSGSDAYGTLLPGHGMPVSRSSYTKEFIHNHDGTKRLRNNSVAILETKPRMAHYFERPPKRRQTFPGPTDSHGKMEEGMSSCRESFSSGMLSPFFLQSLPLQAERLGRFYMDDEGSFPFSEDSRKSSGGSSGYKASSSNFNGYSYGADSSTCGNGRSCFCPCRAGEDQEETFSSGQDAQHGQVLNQMAAPVLIAVTPPHGDSYTDAADPGNEQLEHSEVAESGFDEEMPEVEELHHEFAANNLILKQRDLLIQVTPPSLSGSEEHIVEDSCESIILREGVANPKPNQPETIASTDFLPDMRKGSVMTSIIGGCERRSIQNDTEPLEIMENQRELSSVVLEAPSMSSAQDMEDKEEDGHSEPLSEMESTPRRSLTVESNDSIQTLVQEHEAMEPSGSPTETQAGMNFGPPSLRDAHRGAEDEGNTKMGDVVTAATDTNGSSHESQDSGVTDSKTRLQQTDSGERLSMARSPTDVKTEVKERLRPPVDLVLKDQEDVVDHWAKRRKLFKESKQWSSAGGSSLTSNITEESVTSDDGRSVDVSARDMEERGFYTETFHSASWIYRGDDTHPAGSPRCLSTRPRPVTIRERTVRISKGTGDYPWGFRIQFSKPIVVTEVDTSEYSGAGEHKGGCQHTDHYDTAYNVRWERTLVGDTVLSVNGTDVTSVSHSEAAELAKQGRDVLTLTIGSDISRHPSTPRPACRGYLHKRTQSGLLKGWRKRWFVLKHDCCLYYYRRKRDEGKTCALSAMKLEGAEVGPDTSLGKPFVFKCSPLSCARVYYFCATSNQEMKRWLEAMDRAVQPPPQNHVWIDVARHNSSLPPLAIKSPECLGLLHQLDGNKDFWVQHYCILKDACLYFYTGIRSTHAMGGIFLQGYTVCEQANGSRCSTIELKPPSEEFKSFYLCAESATETKRWISAIKASISKWVLLHQAIEEFMSRPAEETRM
ncbi:uncharacterized protein pdzph1 [Anguilla rostrata]|uniref:uncharacterized protein pdzph1 n=1 Tax=Anguilla rostrata TaxID=7938 RepID=UPI0030CC3959